MASRQNIPPQLRFSILSRDRFTCRYCSRSAPDVELHVDHVMPVAKGGTNDPDNLVAACVECNAGKSADTIDHLPDVPRPRARSRRHPLIGFGFLSFIDGKLAEQGLITDVVEAGDRAFAVVFYFEWLMGERSYGRMIDVADLAFDERSDASNRTYRLFTSNEDRNSYHEWRAQGGATFEDGAR